MPVEVDVEKLRFTTDEGRLTFIRLEPPTQPDTYGNWDYQVEIAWEAAAPNKSMKLALATLAEATMGKRGIPKGVIKTLDQTNKDEAKNKHLEGMVFATFKKKINPKDRNLADPQERKEFLNFIKTQSPNLFRLDESGRRHDAKAQDFFRGCYGRIIGHCYFQSEFKKYCLTIDHVILTRKGERIGGGPIDPENDRLLNELAPAAEDAIDAALNASDDDIEELPF